jgi:hypothetical protein
MRYLLRAHEQHEWDGMVWAATVSVYAKDAAYILELMAIVRDLYDSHDVAHVHVFDWSPTWYEYTDDLEDEEWIRVSAKLNIDADVIRQDAPRMVVSRAAVWWAAFQKNTNIRMFTEEIPREELERIVKEEAQE